MQHVIVQAHNHGHNNIGDDAMAANVFNKLKDIDPNLATITSYSRPPGQIEDRDYRSLTSIVMDYHNPLQKMLIVGLHRLKLKALFGLYVWIFCETVLLGARLRKSTGLNPFGRTAPGRLIEVIANAKAYVRSGSGSLNDIWFWSSMYLQFTEARICNVFGTKIYFLGQGLGPFTTSYQKNTLKSLMEITEGMTLRDKVESADILDSLGCSLSRYRICGDDAIDFPKDPLPESIASRFAEMPPLVVCQFRSTNYEDTLPDSLWAEVADQLVQLQEALGCRIVLVSFSDGRTNDLVPAKRVNELSGGKLEVIEERLTPGQHKQLISQAILTIGQSYHFGVFSLAENVPFIAIYSNEYYRTKHQGLLAWYDMERCALSMSEVGKLSALAGEISRTNLRHHLLAVNQNLTKNINSVFKQIRENAASV